MYIGLSDRKEEDKEFVMNCKVMCCIMIHAVPQKLIPHWKTQ